MAKRDYDLFPLTGKDLRTEYPELSQVEEFKSLSSKEMAFVYLYANESSPYFAMKERDRIIKCLEVIKNDLSGQQMDDYFNLNFPANISSSIERMKKFNAHVREQAKEITDKIFKNIKKIISLDPEQMIDMNEKARYVSMSMDVIKNMPELIHQIENGYGIRTKNKKSNSVSANASTWDKVMSDEEEK